MGPPGPISLGIWDPKGGPKALVFWGSPSEIGPTRACACTSMAESSDSECQYSFTAIKEYLTGGVYPDKKSKQGLRKRSKYFILDSGHLMYIGGKVKKTPRLVVEGDHEQMNIIQRIHDVAHLGRDKILSQLNERYYWPNMYKQVCEYVSLLYCRWCRFGAMAP